METIEELKRHFTLPELLDHLDVDYDELQDTTLLEFIEERAEDIKVLLEEV